LRGKRARRNNDPPTSKTEIAMYATLAAADFASASAAGAPRTVRVRSADELRGALRQSRHQPLALDASGLDRVLRLDSRDGLLEVQAAASWAALADYVRPRGLALDAFASADSLPVTVGEAISRNGAGPDGRPVSAHVAAIALVTPDGELKRASCEYNPELFRLVLGGHGVFGLLYSATLRLESLARSAKAMLAPAELCVPEEADATAVQHRLECLLPPDELDTFLVQARELAAPWRIAWRRISVRRLLPERETALPWATREWAEASLHFSLRASLGASVRAAQAKRELLAAALERGGAFPISEPSHASRTQLERCYPSLSAFLAEKRRADPGERLQNRWYLTVCAKLRGESCEVRWAN
jgi:FAD/FMN-containing dehydrogenase